MTNSYTKKEVFRIMKITAFQFIMVCILAGNGLAWPASSQELLNERVTLSIRDGNLKSFLRTLEKQVDITFSYQKDVIMTEDRLNLEFRNETVDEVLRQVLTPRRIQYKVIRNNQVILSRKPSAGSEAESSGQDSGKEESTRIPAETYADRIISGKVKAVTGEGLPGVSIIIKGTTRGMTTDAEGNYQIAVPESTPVLIFSFVGYESREIDAGSMTKLDVVLAADVKALGEVVVVGYGTQKKTSVTAAVSTLKGNQVATAPIANLSNGLGGRVAGVIVKQGSGEPGRDGSSIFIRGISSTGNNQPLLIVDGIPRNFQQLDPNTIESFTILKDAAAVAPYGVAGANGVVLVTTKRGKTGAPALTYNGYIGFQNPTVLPRYADSFQEATLKNAAARNAGLTAPYSDYALQKFKDGSDPDAFPNHDVFNKIVEKNAVITTHNIELSGGGEKIRYYTSLGYQHQEGMWKTTSNNRYNLSVNLDAQATKTTKVSLGINGIIQNAKYPPSDQSGGTTGRTGRIFELAGFAQIGYGPLVYSNGMYGSHIMPAIFASGYEKNNTTSLYTQLTIEQEVRFIKGLMLKGTIAFDPTYNESKLWKTPLHLATIDTTKRPYVITDGIFGDVKPSLAQNYNRTQQLTYQASINYTRSFGRNNIGLLGVFEAKANDAVNYGASRRNYNLTIDEINMGSSSQADIGTSGSSVSGRQMGLVYRATYDYADKYLFEASGRYDGSYYFSPENRFGFFPAFSVGYRISEEAFLKDNVKWLDNLKLRGSYGEVGALAGSAFQYLSTYNVLGTAYVLGNNAVQGISERAEPNVNITWERAKKTDIGLEATLWKGLLNLEIDYFYEKRSNMLVNPDVIVPKEYGVGLSQVNAGIMDNRGFDLSLSSNYKISGDLHISLGGNLTYAKNKLLKVFETPVTYDNPNRRVTGRPLGTQFGFQSLGYFQTSDFNEAGNLKAGIASQPWGKVFPGDIRYADQNGDGVINDNDLTAIGDANASPRIIYGIMPSIRYKGLSLDLLFQGSARTNWYYHPSSIMPFWNGMKPYEQNMDYWTPENPNAKNPRLTTAPTTNNSQVSSFWMGNAAYLRLKTMTLAYSLPVSLIEKIKMQNARIYISGQNMITWTKLVNYDPELGSNNSYVANSGWTYPQQKVVSVGVNVTF